MGWWQRQNQWLASGNWGKGKLWAGGSGTSQGPPVAHGKRESQYNPG